MYSLRILGTAARELAGLDRPVAKRLVDRIAWLAENVEQIRPEALTGDLAGLFKFRVGSYRVLYQVLEREQTVIVHHIGHRRDVYRLK